MTESEFKNVLKVGDYVIKTFHENERYIIDRVKSISYNYIYTEYAHYHYEDVELIKI